MSQPRPVHRALISVSGSRPTPPEPRGWRSDALSASMAFRSATCLSSPSWAATCWLYTACQSYSIFFQRRCVSSHLEQASYVVALLFTATVVDPPRLSGPWRPPSSLAIDDAGWSPGPRASAAGPGVYRGSADRCTSATATTLVGTDCVVATTACLAAASSSWIAKGLSVSCGKSGIPSLTMITSDGGSPCWKTGGGAGVELPGSACSQFPEPAICIGGSGSRTC